MHTINKSGTMTPEESRLVMSRSKRDVASLGCMVVFGIVGPVYMCGRLGSWIGGFVSESTSTSGQWIGWVVAGLFSIAVLVSFTRFEKSLRSRALKDLEKTSLQVIHVTNPRVTEVDGIGNSCPALVFDIGQNTLLLLQGDWLLNQDLYGAGNAELDGEDEVLNGLASPYSFPSTEFTIRRLEHSGEVVGISVAGQYLDPVVLGDVRWPEVDCRDSELFEGSLENWQRDLTTASQL